MLVTRRAHEVHVEFEALPRALVADNLAYTLDVDLPRVRPLVDLDLQRCGIDLGSALEFLDHRHDALGRPGRSTDAALKMLAQVGSHRQFTLLARHVAGQGLPVFRFDCRGMGDSGGDARTFEEIDADIRAAIDAFLNEHPRTNRVVLWGLCDGASAAMMYAPSDARVCGLILVNPWVRDDQTLAATQVKHYYGARIMSRAFWRKLMSGEVAVLGAIGGLASSSLKAFGKHSASQQGTAFQERMLDGWRRHPGPELVLLSGNDLTAKEFFELSTRDPRWQSCLSKPGSSRLDMPQADHTFSTAQWRSDVERAVSEWLGRLA